LADRVRYIVGKAIRSVAADNDFVGRGLLITVMPRASLGATAGGGFLIAGGTLRDQQTFRYVPPDVDETVVYGPTYTCGGAQMTDFEARP
jgi:hypothetical protein